MPYILFRMNPWIFIRYSHIFYYILYTYAFYLSEFLIIWIFTTVNCYINDWLKDIDIVKSDLMKVSSPSSSLMFWESNIFFILLNHH